MRLIDADALKTIRSIQSADYNSIETIQHWIDNAQTIDAVPVVRCKDCVYGIDRTEDFQDEDERWDVVNPIACMMYSSDRIPDFFPKDNYCGFGKMRDDEERRDDE